MSKSVGSYAQKSGSVKAAIHPAKMGHIQGHMQPQSKGVPPKKEAAKQAPIASLSDNPSWGKVREGNESPTKADPAWGYTGHPFARRFDDGEEDLSMASRISRRMQRYSPSNAITARLTRLTSHHSQPCGKAPS